MNQSEETPPTVITLTLPTPERGGIAPERATATLLIQRGDLAQVRQFHYTGYLPDVMEAIREATEALSVLADNPPVVPDLPAEKPRPEPKKKAKATQKPQPQADEEPTIDIPLRKGVKAVKMSHLKIVGGENDAAAYRQAVLIAGRLIAGGLWDGESQIRINDVYTTMKNMKHLTDRDFSLFSLEDFVQTGAATGITDTSDEDDNTKDIVPAASASLNGHHPDEASTLL